MPFPLAKLGYMAIRQMAKPVAAAIKQKAKTNTLLRNYILLPPAQLYHRFDTTFKMRILGLGKVKNVKPMTEAAAIDLSSDMLGELFIFSVGSACIYWEYRRQMNKDKVKENVQNDRLSDLEQVVVDLGIQVEQQSAQIRELTRSIAAIPNMGITQKNPSSPITRTIKDPKSGTVLVVENR